MQFIRSSSMCLTFFLLPIVIYSSPSATVSPLASPSPVENSTSANEDVARSVRQEIPKDLIKRTDRMIRRGNVSEAETLLVTAVNAHPDNAAAKLALASLRLKQRAAADAYRLSYEVAKDNPKNAAAFAFLAQSLIVMGRFDDAELMVNNALTINRREPQGWASLALLHFYHNRLADSLACMRQAVWLNRSNPDFLFLLGQIAARAENYGEAANAYSMFLDNSRNSSDERFDRVRGLVDFLRFLESRNNLYVSTGKNRTKVNFELVGNRPLIEIRINGRSEPLKFVLDTGSGVSVLSEETAKKLKISPVSRGGYAKGLGGNGKFEIVYGFLQRVEIGDVAIRNVPVYIREFHGSAKQVDGYIGLSLISRFLTTLDYGDRTFELNNESDAAELLLQPGATTMNMRLTSSGFFSSEVKMEGLDRPLNFILDTGASVSVISEELAGHEPINNFVTERTMRVIGSAGIAENVPSYMLPKVRFGDNEVESVTAVSLDMDLINEASGFYQAGILGGNVLRHYRLTFDFRNAQLTFVPISDPR